MSPSYALDCRTHADMNCINFGQAGLLGFKLDAFVSNTRTGGFIDSPYFPHPTEIQLDELRSYMEMNGYKLRLKSDDNGSFLTYPTGVDDVVAQSLNESKRQTLRERGCLCIPFVTIMSFGTANVPAELLNAWNDATGGAQLTGVGFEFSS